MDRPKISSNSENLQSVIEIYENLFYLLDRNLDRFLSVKKEAENEKKKYGEMQKDFLESEPDISNSLDSFLNFELPNSIFEFHFKYEAKVTEKNEHTDVGVISKKYNKHLVICFIEAKRLPTDKIGGKREKEYVLNGIKRFKTNKHGNKLPYSIMIAYVQQDNCDVWFQKINSWINEEIFNAPNNNISWREEDKLTANVNYCIPKFAKFHSIHSRKDESSKINLVHYWMELC